MRFSRPRRACRTRWTRWAPATEATYEQVLPRMLADPGIDAVIVLFVPPVVASAQDVADAVGRAAAGAEKPVLTSLISGAAMTLPPGVTNFAYPESAGRALGIAAARAEWLRRPAGSTPSLEGIDPDAARSVVAAALEGREEAWLDPAGTRAVLEAYGIPVVPELVVGTAAEAAAAALELGLPAVVKSAVPGAHKTETGGVAVGLESEAEVREAAERIGPPSWSSRSSAAVPSFSRGSSRTRSSGRSSPSVRAASLPS